jgi:hypothetical protein
MKVKEYIEYINELSKELKEYDGELPIEMIVTAPHSCCSCCGSGDSYCYSEGTEYAFTSLIINEEKVYDKKLKKQVLKKLWVRGEY